MEYLEGGIAFGTAALERLPLPLRPGIAIRHRDYRCLDKSHRKGVTHRSEARQHHPDRSGTKLLDFGLAKLKQAVAPANVQLSQLPTANEPLTAQGTIVGTLQYGPRSNGR